MGAFCGVKSFRHCRFREGMELAKAQGADRVFNHQRADYSERDPRGLQKGRALM